MALDDLRRAEEARQRGNELYKKGNLRGAEIEYKAAASLAPDDPTPRSNLSSVKFEQGQYSEAIRFICESLELAKHVPLDEAVERREKALYARLVKCYMHECQFDKARDVIQHLSDQELKNSASYTLDGLAAWGSSECHNEKKLHRTQVFDRLPRYKAHLQDVAEYYAIGHDDAESLFDRELEQSCSARNSLSFMLCGSGDARHLFTTLAHIHLMESMGRTKVCKDLHITILDLKPAALARTLILFDMLMVYAMLKVRKTPGIEDAPAVMAYIYAGHVIPAAVNEKLQTHIQGLIESLEAGEPLFKWLFVPAATVRQVVVCLKQWNGTLAPTYCRTKTVRKAVGNRVRITQARQNAVFGRKLVPTPPGMERDKKVFDDLTVLLPSKGFAGRRDPALVPLMQKYEKGSKTAIKELGDYIDANWVTNPTLIDVDYAERAVAEWLPWAHHGATDEDKVPAIEADPIELAGKLSGLSKAKGALETVGSFFGVVSLALVMFSDRLKIEALVGEMTDVMERIRWDCLESRSQPSGGIDPSTFPSTYDRIHMSNIPDYVGGLLNAAMYGRPLLRDDKPSNLRFVVLLNPPMFQTHNHFQAEYLLMYNNKRIKDHFSLTRKADGDQKILESMGAAGDLANMLPDGTKALGSFMYEGYIVWERSPAGKLTEQNRLARTALEKWLYAHFLKICLPYARRKSSDRPVHAPLNLTAFLRLVSLLSERGYPSHWLSGVLAALCGDNPDGEIVTTARAPRQIVTDEADVDAVHPAIRITIAPWKAEFTTLLSIWSRLLPFGFIAPPGAVIQPRQIAEYSVCFPKFIEDELRAPHFVLLFWDPKVGEIPGTGRMRRLLLDDEMGDTSEMAMDAKRRGVHVFSTFKFITDSRTASFWCRTDTMEEMTRGGWKVYIWRTDTWERVTQGVSVKDVQLVRAWD